MVNRLEAAKVLLGQGYINEQDLTLQELDCRLANIYCLKARLDYIIEVLKY